MDTAAERAIGRGAIARISWRLLPLIGLSYLVASVDRANIGFASLQMNTDLGFGPAIYGLGAGIFFAAAERTGGFHAALTALPVILLVPAAIILAMRGRAVRAALRMA
jgi:hypothetical protein